MANFDAMVPLIPKDTRLPVEQARDQMKINQVEKIQELRAVSEEENTRIDNERERKEHQEHQQQREQSDPETGTAANTQPTTDDSIASDSGHIDTYA
jgi:hypothetical protein